MTSFEFGDRLDFIVALFGVMAYNENKRQLEMTFQNIYNHLAEKGLFVFDVGFTTRNFRNHTEVIECKEKPHR